MGRGHERQSDAGVTGLREVDGEGRAVRQGDGRSEGAGGASRQRQQHAASSAPSRDQQQEVAEVQSDVMKLEDQSEGR